MSEERRDYRMAFVKEVEAELTKHIEPERIEIISDIMVKILSNYEIVDRCTDLVIRDDFNERIIKRYGACLLLDGKSEKTVYQYIRTVHKLSDTLGKPFKEMGTYDVRFFLALEKERGISNRTLENTRANLSAFFQWMTNDEIISKNPIAGIKPIKYPDEIKKPFSEIEIDALRGACASLKERALVEVLLSTGVRVSELSLMDVKDINFDTMSVHVVHGKGSKERMTYTTPVCISHLKAYIDNRSEDGEALFYNSRHERLCTSGIQFILHELAKRAHVDNVHPHRFRRTFATNLAKRGMDVQEIQKLMGHSNINTTMGYICMDDTNIQSSYRKFIS